MAQAYSHYPIVEHRIPVLPEPANSVTPPDGFDPDRDGAAAWLALRMQRPESPEFLES